MKKIKYLKSFLFLFVFVPVALFFASKFEFSFENQAQDLYIKKFAQNSEMDNIKLIIIDEKSADRVKYPWPRDMYIDIYTYLNKFAQAKIIFHDAVITSYDEAHPESDETFFNRTADFKNIISGYNFFYEEKIFSPEFEKERDSLFEKNALCLIDNRTIVPPENVAFSTLVPEYLRNIEYLGNVEAFPDKDGVVRTLTPFQFYKHKAYPLMALKGYTIDSGINEFVVDDKYLCDSKTGCKTFKMPVSSLREGYASVFALVNWYKPKYTNENAAYSHKVYSAIDIYDSYQQIKRGEKPVISPDEFKQNYVFLGGCAETRLLRDILRTSVSTKHSGTDIQATIFENFMTGKFLKKMNTFLNLLIICCIGLLSVYCIKNKSVKTASIFTVSMLFGYYALTVLMIKYRILMLIITPLVIEIFILCWGYTYKFLLEDKTKRKLQGAMAKYLSKDVMKKVVKNIDNISIGGKRADVSVMFVDIRGFTSISEKMPPEEITEILNEYIATVEPIVRKYGGIVNKFIGDAVMAIFGESANFKNHAKSAVFCANEILEVMNVFQNKLEHSNKPKIEIGIGICTGEVFAGNIGYSERMEYTVIGDVVNTANRIEGFNKIYKTHFLISQETYERTREFIDVIAVKDVEIRGKTNKINIYEVLRVFK